MGIIDTAKQWQAEGRLDAEYTQLQRILGSRKFTRQQIDYCFETMVPALAMLAADRETCVLTIGALKKKFNDVLADETHVIEVCGVFVETQGKPENEILRDLARDVRNRIWQFEESGDEDADEE